MSTTSRRKRLFLPVGAFLFLVMLLSACGGGGQSSNESSDKPQLAQAEQTAPAGDPIAEGKGVGPAARLNIELGPIDETKVKHGNDVYGLKCQSCHSLGENRIVGPGWKGITVRRKPEWIINMVMNVDQMLEKDPEAQKQLEVCLMRMPNQSLSFSDARDVLEFMRKQDGAK